MTTRPSVREQAAAAANGTDLERQPQPTIGQLVQRMEGEFAKAMPKGLEAQQLVRDALTVLQQNPGLANVDGRTVLGGLMTCAQLGLRPAVLGEAWLIPFKGKAQLIIGVQGFTKLAYQSGMVADLYADRIYHGDTFKITKGSRRELIHEPLWPRPIADRGDPLGYYACVRYVNGGHGFYVMTREEMIQHKDRFAMARDKDTKAIIGPWRDHFDAMAEKTTVRMLAKWMPRSTHLAAALVSDESVRVDVSAESDPVHVSQRPALPAGVNPATGEIETGQDGQE